MSVRAVYITVYLHSSLPWCHWHMVPIGYTLYLSFHLCPLLFESIIYGTFCVGRYAVVLCSYCGGLSLVFCILWCAAMLGTLRPYSFFCS